MKTIYRSISAIFLGCWLLAGNLFAFEYDIRGQLSGWTHESGSRNEWQNQSGLRYIPQMRLEQMLTDESWLDLEVAANGVVSYQSESSEADADLDLYRLTLRLATAQSETRVGLQKINFGPARLLRALQWFDQLDQRDPQQLTEGVYASLFRYTALNNANMWLWGLYGNDEPKGFERFPSVKDEIEVGGRFQYPAFTGELAATVHVKIMTQAYKEIASQLPNDLALFNLSDVQAELQQRYPDMEWAPRIKLGDCWIFPMRTAKPALRGRCSDWESTSCRRIRRSRND